MLSFATFYSMFLAIPLSVLRLSATRSWGVKTARYGPTKLRLWLLMILIPILGIDLAIIFDTWRIPRCRLCIFMVDAAVLGVPLVLNLRFPLYLWELWWIAITIGTLNLCFIF